jgi:hypothetical protein
MIEFFSPKEIVSFADYKWGQPPEFKVTITIEKECSKESLMNLTYLGSFPNNTDDCLVWDVKEVIPLSTRKGARILANTKVDLLLSKKSPKAAMRNYKG